MKIFIPFVFFSVIFSFSTFVSAGQSITRPADSIYTYADASSGGIGKFYLGREIAHIVSSSATTWLDRPDREQEENANLAVQKMPLKKDDVVADIGAGTGYYTFKIAPRVPQGKVYAEDVQDAMIKRLNEKKQELNIKNVEVIKGTDTAVNLPTGSVDLVIMVDVYHELEYPHETLQSIKNALKKNGKILLIEYRGEDPNVQRSLLHKTTVKQLNKELAANGFTLTYRGEFLPIQHFLIYQVDKKRR
ncbi:class I SAM-dependent methyltransferase [Segetibacter koreensis]|uniref:class I SAM-dependent methyltransferase n=1 Tax=Segetibacter koreensis TaxID=398037 RepID=UPI000368716E|nr:class I SAM-dependent methyltransferase [Segetibacter koreensis]